jgi:hypothetical protein
MKFNKIANSILKEEILSGTLYLLKWSEPYEGDVIYGIYDSKENAGKALLHALKEDPAEKDSLTVVAVPLNPSKPEWGYIINKSQEVDMSYEGWNIDSDTKDAFRGVADQL